LAEKRRAIDRKHQSANGLASIRADPRNFAGFFLRVENLNPHEFILAETITMSQA